MNEMFRRRKKTDIFHHITLSFTILQWWDEVMDIFNVVRFSYIRLSFWILFVGLLVTFPFHSFFFLFVIIIYSFQIADSNFTLKISLNALYARKNLLMFIFFQTNWLSNNNWFVLIYDMRHTIQTYTFSDLCRHFCNTQQNLSDQYMKWKWFGLDQSIKCLVAYRSFTEWVLLQDY